MSKARDLANIISGSGTLNANVIPNLPTSKITSGTFADARLSSSSVTQYVDLTSLSASNLTSGTVPSARLSLAESDVPNLSAAKITSGTMDGSRISGGTFGAVNGSSLTSLPSSAPTNAQILTGVASAGANVVGSYASLYNASSFSSHTQGQTQAISGSDEYRFSSTGSTHVSTSYPSGTWRCMGYSNNQGGSGLSRASIWLRIS